MEFLKPAKVFFPFAVQSVSRNSCVTRFIWILQNVCERNEKKEEKKGKIHHFPTGNIFNILLYSCIFPSFLKLYPSPFNSFNGLEWHLNDNWKIIISELEQYTHTHTPNFHSVDIWNVRTFKERFFLGTVI